MLAGVVALLARGVYCPAQLVISEFCASNASGLKDRNEDFSDWIEVYNPGTGAVSLAGWRLTDSTNDLAKWVFPATNIAAGGYVIVFASGKDRYEAGDELHTNFELKKSGEYLALVTPAGAIAHEFKPVYPPQLEDASYGIVHGVVTNTLIAQGAACTYIVPVNNSVDGYWSWADFDDSGWSNGVTGLGFDRNGIYNPYIATSVSNLMYNQRPGLYMRIPFQVTKPSTVRALYLSARLDDGLVLYLNSREVLRKNAPTGTPNYNSAATAENPGSTWINLPISQPYDRLEPGTNIFALHAMNRSSSNVDFLIVPELKAVVDVPGTGALSFAYFKPPSPGEANNPLRTINGPMIEWTTDRAVGIAAGSSLAVTARVSRTFNEIATVTAYWRVMYGAESAVSLRDDGAGGDAVAGDGLYYGVLPATGLTTSQMLRWRFEARDVSNRVSKLPSYYDFADSAQYYGAVVEDTSVASHLPIFYWFTLSTAAAETEAGTRCSVYFLSNFYDNVGVDLHGQSSVGFPFKSQNFDFNADDDFLYAPGERKVHDIDLLSTTWPDKAKVRVATAYGFMRDADLPAHFAFPVRVHRNGSFHSLFDMVEDADDRYLKRAGLNPDGALYKMYNTFNGWTPPGAEKKTRRDEDNSDLQSFITELGKTGDLTALARYVFDTIDLPRAVNYFTTRGLVNDKDHGHKNYYVYRDTTGTGEWTILPWDADLCLGHCWTTNNAYLDDTIFTNNTFNWSGSDNRFYWAMYNLTVPRRMIMRRMRTLMDEFLRPPGETNGLYFEPRLEAAADLIDPPDVYSDYDAYFAKWASWGNMDSLRQAKDRILYTFLPGRRQYLYYTMSVNSGGEIPDSQPAHPLLIIKRVEVSPASGNQDQEYIEILNTNSYYVDLSGWVLSNAVDFVFHGGTVIPSGGSVYVSPNAAAFRARPVSPHSNETLFVTGPYGGHLSTWGEQIDLWDRAGGRAATTNYPASPSAWQQALRVTEIMYRPTAPPDSAPIPSRDEYEFVELKNTSTNALNLNGVRFAQGIDFAFTNDFVLPAGGLVAVVRNLAAFASRYDTNGILVVGGYLDYLGDNGETVKLEDPVDETILEFDYKDGWSALADGGGYSLIMTNQGAAHDFWGEETNWAGGTVWQGTPGRDEPEWPIGTVVINEALPHTDAETDWIEIRNLAGSPVHIGGWWLSDDLTEPRKFVIPTGTVLSNGGFVVYDQGQFDNTNHPGCVVPFALSELGDEVHLTAVSNGQALSYRESVVFDASDREITFGRHVRTDGRAVFPAMSAATRGGANVYPRVGPAVLSEILYDPPTDGQEFIEIYAATSGVLQLWNPAHPTNTWKLTGGISYQFPPGSVITGGQYAVVVSDNPFAFRASNGIPASVKIYGPFSGQLNAGGERVRLRKPGDPEADGYVPYIVVDEVEFDDDPPWPAAGRIGGRSIERVSLSLFGNDPATWRAGLPGGTPGAPLSSGDSDGDGLPDEWELDQFGDIALTDGSGDADGDRLKDGGEFLAGTAVSNAASRLTLDVSNAVPPVIWFDTLRAEGPGYQGRRRFYDLEYSRRLSDNVWSNVDGCVNIEGTGLPTLYPVPTLQTGRSYRIRVRIEDQP